MKVLRPGHRYELAFFEKKEDAGQVLQFIEKTPVAEGSTELRTVHDGTTNEEVLEVLLDRLETMNQKLPYRHTSMAITHIEHALMCLERRTKLRKQRGVEGTMAK